MRQRAIGQAILTFVLKFISIALEGTTPTLDRRQSPCAGNRLRTSRRYCSLNVLPIDCRNISRIREGLASKGLGAWEADQRSSGPIPPSIRGLAARRWLEPGERRLRATFATQRNGRSGAVRLNGGIIRADARPNPIGALRCCGTAEHGRFRPSMGGASACFARPWPTCSTIKSIQHGVPICSTSFVNATNWTGSS